MLRLLKIKISYYSFFIVGLYVILTIIYNHIFFTEIYFSQWYEGILTQTQLQEAVSMLNKWEWGIIAMNIFMVFVKIVLVAACLYLGSFFLSNKINYKDIYNIVLKSEIICLVCYVVRLLWFQFVHPPESVEALQVMPLSMMSFFDTSIIEPWLIYPLNTMNIFEVLYFVMLSALMAEAIQIKFRKAFDLVFVSYGAGLLLLIVVQMFLILNNS